MMLSVAQTIHCQIIRWLMNCKGYGRKWSRSNLKHYPDILGEGRKRWIRTFTHTHIQCYIWMTSGRLHMLCHLLTHMELFIQSIPWPPTWFPFNQNFAYISYFFHICYVSGSTQISWFNYRNNLTWRIQIIKLSACIFLNSLIYLP
jgi:hypothetical protein